MPELTPKEINQKAKEESFDSDSELRDRALTEIFKIEERKDIANASREAEEDEERKEELKKIDDNWARDRRY
jgi:chromosome segregation and condensation protein ScpB